MTRVKNGGRELVVNDSEVAAYLEMGYAVIDESGKTVTPGKPMTYGHLIAENEALKSREEVLENALNLANAEIESLRKKLEERSVLDESSSDLATRPELAQISLKSESMNNCPSEKTEAESGVSGLKTTGRKKAAKT